MTRPTILAVDDNETNLLIIQELFGEEFDVHVTATGLEGLELAEMLLPDIVLLDVMMPGVDGYETCRRIRESKWLSGTKVIMVSAGVSADQRIAGYEVGADDYVTKPFDNQEIMAKVRVYSRLKAAEEDLREKNLGLRREIEERTKAEQRQQEMQTKLLESSRLSGMADVATGTLHNVGNVLNSVNISATLVLERLEGLRVKEFAAVSDLVEAHKSSLAEFVAEDARGQLLPDFLVHIREHLEELQGGCLTELEQLQKNIDHIKEIVRVQQSFASATEALEEMPLIEPLEDAISITMASMNRHRVHLQREYEGQPTIFTDRHVLMQVLINLISNASQACVESNAPEKRVTVKLRSRDGVAEIAIVDNGIGISKHNLEHIFQHGFTTKENGHGFGLHSAALSAKRLNGSLTASSDGTGQGAMFVLRVPSLSPAETLQ